jgi:hypothetical protein
MQRPFKFGVYQEEKPDKTNSLMTPLQQTQLAFG